MGPSIIFDKSVLQSLNPDEAMWLDNFYLSNITPIFFVETLADLEKNIRSGRTPEEVVGNLAYKTPDASSKVNAHHQRLVESDLWSDHPLDLKNGRPHISGGKTVVLGNKTGVLFEPSEEEEAFSRWQKFQFVDLERQLAKKWRKDLSNIDLTKIQETFKVFFPLGYPRDLLGVKRAADFYLDGPNHESIFIFGLSLIGVSEVGQQEALKRWREKGKPSLRDFAPYFMHVYSVDFFFYLAITAGLVGSGRPSHKIDIAYLYYLPFCNIFTSNDKLHLNIAPLFLREDQTFISGKQLKDDLSMLDKHYDVLSEEIKKRGVISFAFYPPKDDKFLTTRLWDKYMSKTWREHNPKPAPQKESSISKNIKEEINKIEEGPAAPSDTLKNLDQADSLVVRRMVRGKKGKWNRYPPEVLNRRKNDKGEWENI